MKYYRIHFLGRHIIVLAAGLTVENGMPRLYTTNAVDLIERLAHGLREISVTHTQSDKGYGYVEFQHDSSVGYVSIEEVQVSSVLPAV